MGSARAEASSELDRCLSEIAERLKPPEHERILLESETSRVVSALWRALERAGRKELVLSIEPQGSFARDTWLSGDVDIDVFLLFKKDVDFKTLGETARIVSQLAAEDLGAGLETKYASHPYYVIKLGSLDVEVVPAYLTSSPSELLTPVDRTPHHTEFVRKALAENPQLKEDIRVFKKLLKIIGIYGAEVWVGGFSGYLSEILVIHYGGILSLLQAVADWKPRKTFIPDNSSARRFAGAPLVVLDPVDSGRNAAAAVSLEAMLKLVAVARLVMMKNELLCCFLDPPKLRINESSMRSLAERKHFLFVSAGDTSTIPLDALRGKLVRVMRKLRLILEKNGFTVLRYRFVDLSSGPLISLELETKELPLYKKHLGPPITSPNSLEFLRKWVSQGCGPYLEGYRWVAAVPRRLRLADDVVRRFLAGYPGLKWELLDFEEVFKRCITDEDRRKLYSWITGVEEWMLCLLSASGA